MFFLLAVEILKFVWNVQAGFCGVGGGGRGWSKKGASHPFLSPQQVVGHHIL